MASTAVNGLKYSLPLLFHCYNCNNVLLEYFIAMSYCVVFTTTDCCVDNVMVLS